MPHRDKNKRREDMPGSTIYKRHTGRRFSWFKAKKYWHLYRYSVSYQTECHDRFISKNMKVHTPREYVYIFDRCIDVSWCDRTRYDTQFRKKSWKPPPIEECCPICYKKYREILDARVMQKPGRKPRVDDDPEAWYNVQ